MKLNREKNSSQNSHSATASRKAPYAKANTKTSAGARCSFLRAIRSGTSASQITIGETRYRAATASNSSPKRNSLSQSTRPEVACTSGRSASRTRMARETATITAAVASAGAKRAYRALKLLAISASGRSIVSRSWSRRSRLVAPAPDSARMRAPLFDATLGDPHVDGRSRRSHLVRRQARALAFRDHPRPHSLAALRAFGIRGRARLQDRRRPGDLPPRRAYRALVQFRAHLHDEDPVQPGNPDRCPEGGRASQPARILLHPADRLLRLGKNGRCAPRRHGARSERPLAGWRLPGR